MLTFRTRQASVSGVRLLLQYEGTRMATQSTAEPKVVETLTRRLRGAMLRPTDGRFAVSRRVWNAAIDRHPAAIVLCADAEDVALAVRIAADHGATMTVRGGGHNVAGRCVADNALMIDPTL